MAAESSSLDVVTVPDFSGPRRDHFEARTLLFLGCWTEFGGRARSFPLYLACIGDPPPSVRWLAGRCGARLETFPALVTDGWRGLNKLRGLDVKGGGAHRLLVDTDVLMLANFSGIVHEAPGLAAASAFRQRVPDAAWPAVYAAVDLPLPQAPPYFNGGVVKVPQGCGLRDRWEAYARRIAAAFAHGGDADRALAESDQVALAAAVAALQEAGVPFSVLPAPYNAGWSHLYRRAPPLAHVALFHAVGLFGRTYRADRSVAWNIDSYSWQLVRRLVTSWRLDPQGPLAPRTFATRLVPALRDAWRLRQRLHLVCRMHVVPALRRKDG